MEEARFLSFQLQKGIKRLSGTSYAVKNLSQCLGEGSCGKVYKAYDLKRNELDLAVKIIQKKQLSRLKQQEDLIQKEKKIIDKLPYCINLVNYQKFYLESKNNYYFIMEYCNGGSLYDLLFIECKILSEQEIIKFLVQFLNGYRELLKNNIIHRDIKPQNILIHNGIFKICDFGLSQILENVDDEKNSFFISPFYKLVNLKKQDEPSKDINFDVYSLGVILFQMLFVTPNIQGQNQMTDSKRGQEIHPLIDMKIVYKSQRKDHLQSFINSLQSIDENKPFVFLDNYISTSKIKRSENMITLLKSMLEVNAKKRVTFEQLFQHPLIKDHLDQIDNRSYQLKVQIDKLNDDLLNETQGREIQKDDYLDVCDSKIINLQELKEQLIQQKLQICENIKEELSINCPQLQYFQQNFLHLQQKIAQIKEQSNENEDIIKDDIQYQIKKDQLKNRENEDIQALDIIIRLSESRFSKQQIIKKIEDILQYFRQVYMNYQKIASQLIKSYHIVKETGRLTQTNLINFFDNTVLLSLLIMKDEILNLKQNFKIKLDQSFNQVNKDSEIQNKIVITDEEINIYQNSEEKTLFFQILENDFQELQDLLNNLMKQNQFQSIQKYQQSSANSMIIVKEQFKDFLLQLIKQGIEEFGFLKSNSYQEFQKTLLYLTEAYKHEQNNVLYYQQDQYSQINLQLRLEQLDISDCKSLELLKFCQQNHINIVAQTD